MYKLPFLTMTVYRYTWDNYLKKRLYKKEWPVQCDLAPCTLPHHLMLQRRVGHSGPCTQHQQYPYYQIPRGKQTHCNNIVYQYSHLSVTLLRIKKHELMKIGLFTISLKEKHSTIPLICTMWHMFCTFVLTYEKLHKFSSWQGLWHTSAFCVDCILALHLHHVCKLLSYKKYCSIKLIHQNFHFVIN